ncbi:Hsp20/alpha crystallin family protein [Chitinispirillales bacterium ANBcel5]|uniref:Hsp20/alpha crystallin family protein n=1 Tax=Cellulosispirillum alkaliphilum TaxID=3039283 RepID=UPI002A52B94E|nr:Hsp20/alpha crystallin family protein [Chitinispirillales bacterium ANBcel5]
MAEQSKREQTPVHSSTAEQLVSAENSFSPDATIFDNKEALVLSMDIPGVHKGDVNVEVDENNILTVRAKCSMSEPEAEAAVKEFEPGNFFRSFTLSNEFQIDRITGKLDNGVLEIIIPRKEDVKPRRIQISA